MSYTVGMVDNGEIRKFIGCIFENWFGLQAAISHGMGGTPQQTMTKLSLMTDEISNMCHSSEIGKEDLSDTLEDLVDEFFNTEFEDGSIDEIAAVLWNHKQEWLSGNRESMRTYIAAKREKSNSKILPQKLDKCDEEMDTDHEEPTSDDKPTNDHVKYSSQPVEDADEWTVPRHNRKRNR